MIDSLILEYNKMKKREKKLLEEFDILQVFHNADIKFYLGHSMNDKEWQEGIEKTACYLASASFRMKVTQNKIKQIKKKLFSKSKQKEISLESKSIKDLGIKGRWFWVRGKYSESLKCMNEILKRDPENLNAIFYKGENYKSAKQYDNAIIQYKKVLKINPKAVEAQFMIGEIHHRKNNYKKAIIEHKKAVKINPMHIQAWSSLSYLYKKFGNRKKSFDAYNMYLRASKKSFERNWNKNDY